MNIRKAVTYVCIYACLCSFTTGRPVVDREIQRIKDMGYSIPEPSKIRFDEEPKYNRTTREITLPSMERDAKTWAGVLWRNKWKGQIHSSAAFPEDGFIASQTRHEIAHLIEHRKFLFVNNKWFRILLEIDESTAISEYAATNPWEAFAEAFTIYTSPLYGTKLKRLPKAVEEYLESLKDTDNATKKKAKG